MNNKETHEETRKKNRKNRTKPTNGSDRANEKASERIKHTESSRVRKQRESKTLEARDPSISV